jgi:hypothetical protein
MSPPAAHIYMQSNRTCTTIKSNLVDRTYTAGRKQQIDFPTPDVMKKGARSGVAGPGSRQGGQHKAMTERQEQEQVVQLAAQLALRRATTAQTEEQRVARQAAQLAFLKAGLEEYQRYNAMEKSKGVVEEYRRAGKLHTYDPDKEKQKRFARVANLYPCPWPEHMVERIKECTKYLEEDEEDYRIGLCSLIQE